MHLPFQDSILLALKKIMGGWVQPTLIFVFIILCTSINLLPYQKITAEYLWQKTHNDTVALLLYPSNIQFRFSIAEYYLSNAGYDIEKAKKRYQEVINEDPSFYLAHFQLARIYFIQGKPALAMDHIRTTLKLQPDFKQGYYLYGLISGFSDNTTEAIYGFEEYMKRDDFNWAGYNDLAWVYFRSGRFEKSLELAKKGLEKSPGNAWLLNMQGLSLMNLGEHEQAHVVFTLAKESSEKLTPEIWGKSYPGNDPKIYAAGLQKMREAISHNLDLTKNAEGTSY